MAAAPFGGPTILKLLGLNLKTKSASHVVVGNAAIREKMCKKFEDECGAPIEEFSYVVVDGDFLHWHYSLWSRG